jgi:hypothetical protein
MKPLKCLIGIHDKENTAFLNCNEYLKACMADYHDVFHTGNFKLWFRSIFSKLYVRTASQERKYSQSQNHKFVYDSVCLACYKCFLNIEDEKIRIEETVKDTVNKINRDEVRKKMAMDIYTQRCKND